VRRVKLYAQRLPASPTSSLANSEEELIRVGANHLDPYSTLRLSHRVLLGIAVRLTCFLPQYLIAFSVLG
jgi:hypothetical protein